MKKKWPNRGRFGPSNNDETLAYGAKSRLLSIVDLLRLKTQWWERLSGGQPFKIKNRSSQHEILKTVLVNCILRDWQGFNRTQCTPGVTCYPFFEVKWV